MRDPVGVRHGCYCSGGGDDWLIGTGVCLVVAVAVVVVVIDTHFGGRGSSLTENMPNW